LSERHVWFIIIAVVTYMYLSRYARPGTGFRGPALVPAYAYHAHYLCHTSPSPAGMLCHSFGWDIYIHWCSTGGRPGERAENVTCTRQGNNKCKKFAQCNSQEPSGRMPQSLCFLPPSSPRSGRCRVCYMPIPQRSTNTNSDRVSFQGHHDLDI